VRGPRVSGALVTAAVLGGLCVLGYDAVRLVQVHLGPGDDAQNAALDAAASYHQRADVDVAFDVAGRTARSHGDVLRPEEFQIAADGTVSLTLHRTTSTVVLGRVAPDWQVAAGTGVARWQP